MPQIEFDDNQIAFLMKLSREELDRAQSEMHPMIDGPDEVTAQTARKALATRYDIYMKLLKASGLHRGLESDQNPYRD